MVVSQSSIPTPALVPVTTAPLLTPSPLVPTMTPAPVTLPAPSVVPSEVPLPVTDNELEDKEPEAPKDGIAAAAAEAVINPVPTTQGEKESAPPAAPSQDSANDRRRSRPRSRSSSSRRSDKRPKTVTKPMGLTPPPPDASAKKIRGIGRGKPKKQGLPITPSSFNSLE